MKIVLTLFLLAIFTVGSATASFAGDGDILIGHKSGGSTPPAKTQSETNNPCDTCTPSDDSNSTGDADSTTDYTDELLAFKAWLLSLLG
ncbi:MAG: hypothetical protein ACK5NT_15185 [Pyrinomonadaceae bacterium]